jgi:hypothetical protein
MNRKVVLYLSALVAIILSFLFLGCERKPSPLSDSRFNGLFVYSDGEWGSNYSAYQFDGTNRGRRIIHTRSDRSDAEFEIEIGSEARRDQFRLRYRRHDGKWSSWDIWTEFRFNENGQELRLRNAAGIWTTAMNDRSPWSIYEK